MRVFLIHIRDPQFYALPAGGRSRNGNVRVMGFPPIGIMSLSAVLKRAGHECVMFDQANPETPNAIIIEEIRRQRPALVGLRRGPAPASPPAHPHGILEHYHRWRCHQALDMDCPEPRPIQPREQGAVVEVTEGGGLYRHYERLAA